MVADPIYHSDASEFWEEVGVWKEELADLIKKGGKVMHRLAADVETVPDPHFAPQKRSPCGDGSSRIRNRNLSVKYILG